MSKSYPSGQSPHDLPAAPVVPQPRARTPPMSAMDRPPLTNGGSSLRSAPSIPESSSPNSGRGMTSPQSLLSPTSTLSGYSPSSPHQNKIQPYSLNNPASPVQPEAPAYSPAYKPMIGGPFQTGSRSPNPPFQTGSRSPNPPIPHHTSSPPMHQRSPLDYVSSAAKR